MPDPQHDAVSAVMYCLQDDHKTSKQLLSRKPNYHLGCIAVGADGENPMAAIGVGGARS